MEQFTTKRLLEELAKREGVKTLNLPEAQFLEVVVEGEKTTRVEGPVVFLINID